jgi:hypothetical protein
MEPFKVLNFETVDLVTQADTWYQDDLVLRLTI